MGLKSGSRDAGLDSSKDEADEQAQEETESTPENEEATEQSSSAESNEGEKSNTDSESKRPTIDSIPYKLRRNKVNEGREQVPYFLRGDVIDAESDLQDELEELLGEKVYKSDYREASMVVAQRNPELVAEVLREWGYDLNTE